MAATTTWTIRFDRSGGGRDNDLVDSGDADTWSDARLQAYRRMADEINRIATSERLVICQALVEQEDPDYPLDMEESIYEHGDLVGSWSHEANAAEAMTTIVVSSDILQCAEPPEAGSETDSEIVYWTDGFGWIITYQAAG